MQERCCVKCALLRYVSLVLLDGGGSGGGGGRGARCRNLTIAESLGLFQFLKSPIILIQFHFVSIGLFVCLFFFLMIQVYNGEPTAVATSRNKHRFLSFFSDILDVV